jgi:hypothetical protein
MRFFMTSWGLSESSLLSTHVPDKSMPLVTTSPAYDTLDVSKLATMINGQILKPAGSCFLILLLRARARGRW